MVKCDHGEILPFSYPTNGCYFGREKKQEGKPFWSGLQTGGAYQARKRTIQNTYEKGH